MQCLEPLISIIHIRNTPILEKVNARTARNEVFVQITTSVTLTSKEAHEESIYLFLDLLPKNHGFWGHLSFSHEIEKEMILKPF